MAADETTARKTFRLESAVAELLADEASKRYATENAAINGLLLELKRLRTKQEENEIFFAKKQQEIDDATATARLWKSKYDAKCEELAELQGALQLVGKFLKQPGD